MFEGLKKGLNKVYAKFKGTGFDEDVVSRIIYNKIWLNEESMNRKMYGYLS